MYDLNPIILRRRIGMVFAFPTMSIYDNVITRIQPERHAPGADRPGTASWRRRCAASTLGRVKDNIYRRGTLLVRRPAAEALHRPRAGDETRNRRPRRADLGAGPQVHRGNRRAHRVPEGCRHNRAGHSQYPAGRPHFRLYSVHPPRRPRRVRPHEDGFYRSQGQADGGIPLPGKFG